jgi:hypothetical protein
MIIRNYESPYMFIEVSNDYGINPDPFIFVAGPPGAVLATAPLSLCPLPEMVAAPWHLGRVIFLGEG